MWCHCVSCCVIVLACFRSALIPDPLFPNKMRSPSSHDYHSSPTQRGPFLVYFVFPNPIGGLQESASCLACAVIKQKPYWQSKHQTFFFLAYLPTGKKREIKNQQTFYPCVKSICLSKCCCRHTVNASSPSSLFYSLECCECYWCAGRVVIDGLTGMHNVT